MTDKETIEREAIDFTFRQDLEARKFLRDSWLQAW